MKEVAREQTTKHPKRQDACAPWSQNEAALYYPMMKTDLQQMENHPSHKNIAVLHRYSWAEETSFTFNNSLDICQIHTPKHLSRFAALKHHWWRTFTLLYMDKQTTITQLVIKWTLGIITRPSICYASTLYFKNFYSTANSGAQNISAMTEHGLGSNWHPLSLSRIQSPSWVLDRRPVLKDSLLAGT